MNNGLDVVRWKIRRGWNAIPNFCTLLQKQATVYTSERAVYQYKLPFWRYFEAKNI